MKKLILASSLLALLSACSGGGGGGSEVAEIKPEHNYFSINIGHSAISEKAKGQAMNHNPLTHVVINGKTYELPAVGTKQQFEYPADKLKGEVIQRTKHLVVIGHSPLDEKGITGSYIVQGNLTPVDEVPQSGVFTYESLPGATKWENIIDRDTNISYVDGDASFKVDFGNKKLTGSASGRNYHRPSEIKTLEMAADIVGNQFQGTKDGLTIKGAFFGPHAVQMGGLIESEDKKIYGKLTATQMLP